MSITIQQERIIFINSLLIAFFIDIQCINQFFITFSSNLESVMTLMYIGITILIFFFGLLTNKEKNTSSSRSYFIVLIYVISMYFITSLTDGTPYTSLAFFLVFTIVAYLIPILTKIEPKVVIKATMLFPLPAILRIDEIFYQNMHNSATISMGQSYAFLTPIVASVVYMMLYFKNDKLSHKTVGLIGCSVNFVFFLQLLMFGSRGPLLAIALLLALLFVAKFPTEGFQGISFNKKRLVISVICFVILLLSFLPLLKSIHLFFLSKGVSLSFLNKIILLADSGDISNGRSEIFQVVYDAFIEKPFWGHGFDLFKETGHYYYPHNFLYQTLYDGGLLMILLVTLPTFSRIVKSFKTSNYENITLLIFFFFISVPGATFSGDLWQQGNLWLLTGMLLSNSRMVSRNY